MRVWLLTLLLCMSAAAAAPPDDLLPHSRPGYGAQDLASAWLVAPTDRYRHGVLGDALEAAGLELRTADGRVLRVVLDEDVFEDLSPRVQDLDGDGRDEVWLVRSNPGLGARISVWGLVDGQPRELAAGPWVGRPNRWLNPVGAADFDGDGRVELAYVQTPHIGGSLKLLEYRRGEMTVEYQAEGFSNHAIGSTVLDLHAIEDLDGDGRPELRVPSADRGRWRVMGIRDGRLVQLDLRPRTEQP